jgi:hypothetical protein
LVENTQIDEGGRPIGEGEDRGRRQIEAAIAITKAIYGPRLVDIGLELRKLQSATLDYEQAMLKGDPKKIRANLAKLIYLCLKAGGFWRIDIARYEAQRAANRNASKGGWHRTPVCQLCACLDREIDEYTRAIVYESRQRQREELGDVVWSATMIADHSLYLDNMPEIEVR